MPHFMLDGIEYKAARYSTHKGRTAGTGHRVCGCLGYAVVVFVPQ